MKRLAIGALALLMLAGVWVPAQAQLGNTFGEIYLSRLEDARIPFNRNQAAFSQFNFFIMIDVDFADDGRGEQNATNGLKGWEVALTVPADITVLGRDITPAGFVNVGSGDNFVVGTGSLVPASTLPGKVCTYTAGLFTPTAPTDAIITLGPSDPNSENTGTPNWLEWSSSQIHQFSDTWINNRFVINCDVETECDVATQDTSWGAVKAEF